MDSYGYVTLQELKKAIHQLETQNKKINISDKECKVSFEYLIGSFFPQIVRNVYDEANKQYTLGYLDGLKEGNKNNAS